MDAFFASAEQASKPSLRGKAVVVGGLGPRGVVATASYEARVFGVHSAMPMAQARRLAPNAAYLVPRFAFYRSISEQVMGLLRALSPLVEPLSLDEAFVDLEAGGEAWDDASARLVGVRLRADIRTFTGLTGSVGLAACKMLAKIASEQAKPDGLVLIEPGTERALLGPMSVRTLPGVGPATGDHLRRAGITTVAEIAEAGEDELVRLLGKSHGHGLYAMALAHDERPVVAERETKSVSVEDTYDVDIHDRVRVGLEVQKLAGRCVRRLREANLSGRTIVLKVRRYDFSTLTRSRPFAGPPTTRRSYGRRRPGCWTRWTRRVGSGCWVWASRGSPTTRRRICSPRRRGSGRRMRRRTVRTGRWWRGRRRSNGGGRGSRRAARRVRARMGAGQRSGPGHRAVRDARLGAGPGADLPDRRPGPGAGGPTAARAERARRAAKTRRAGRPGASGLVRACQLAEVVVGERWRLGHVQSVVVVELEFLFR